MIGINFMPVSERRRRIQQTGRKQDANNLLKTPTDEAQSSSLVVMEDRLHFPIEQADAYLALGQHNPGGCWSSRTQDLLPYFAHSSRTRSEHQELFG